MQIVGKENGPVDYYLKNAFLSYNAILVLDSGNFFLGMVANEVSTYLRVL